jgi:hypothetical protein
MRFADGWWAVAVGLAVAVGGALALVVWPPLFRQAIVLIGRIKVRDRVGLVPPVIEARSTVIGAVRDILGSDDDQR